MLSRRARSLFDYFRQQFAQVTNPPIDPLREQIVMSLETCFGREKNMFDETPSHGERLLVDSPVLSISKFEQLLALDGSDYAQTRLELNYSTESTRTTVPFLTASTARSQSATTASLSVCSVE